MVAFLQFAVFNPDFLVFQFLPLNHVGEEHLQIFVVGLSELQLEVDQLFELVVFNYAQDGLPIVFYVQTAPEGDAVLGLAYAQLQHVP